MSQTREGSSIMFIPSKWLIAVAATFAILVGHFAPIGVLVITSSASVGCCFERYPGGMEPPELQLNFLKLGIVMLLNLCMWVSFALT